MRIPEKYRAKEVQRWDCDTEGPNGEWVPARPVNDFTWRWTQRWKMAFYVLIGKYDVLDWEDDKDN